MLYQLLLVPTTWDFFFFFFFVQGAGLPHRSGSTERLGRVLGYGSHSAIVGRKPES